MLVINLLLKIINESYKECQSDDNIESPKLIIINREYDSINMNDYSFCIVDEIYKFPENNGQEINQQILIR